MAPTRVTYHGHHGPEPSGHLFFDVESGPATISLTPAASANQEWLNGWGERIADALNERRTRGAIFLGGNLSEGFKAYGPYEDAATAASVHDGDEGWLLSLEEK